MDNKDWDSLKPIYFERAKDILSKIDGLDRSMTIVHGIAACLPDGDYISDELRTKGAASTEARDSVSGFGGVYDWFFVPEGVGHTLFEFETKEILDNFCGRSLYPITQKITEFLIQSLSAE